MGLWEEDEGKIELRRREGDDGWLARRARRPVLGGVSRSRERSSSTPISAHSPATHAPQSSQSPSVLHHLTIRPPCDIATILAN